MSGSSADGFGRIRRFMAVPMIASVLSTINFIFLSLFASETISPYYVLISASIIGTSTGVLGLGVTCFGLVSITTSVQGRSMRIAFMEASRFLDEAVGFYLIDFIKPWLGFIGVFILEHVMYLLSLAYVIFIIQGPDDSQRYDTTHMSLFSIQHVISMISTVIRPREKNYRCILIMIITSYLMHSYGLAATYQLMFSFLKFPPLNFTTKDYSFYHGYLMLIEGIMIIVALPVLLTLSKMKDSTSGLVWLSFSAKS